MQFADGLSQNEIEQLDQLGYLLFEGFMDEELRLALRERIEALFELEGETAGAEFKQEAGSRRLANLMDKGEIFRQVVAVPKILACAQHVLGLGLKLSSLNARSADPGTARTQPLHADMAAVADQKGYWVCNTVWMLDDFTAANGALRAIPGSHRWRKLPQEFLDDPLAPHPEETIITGKAGSVLIMNAHVWHGGLANRTEKPRVALHAFYCRRDKPQQQNQRQLVRREIQEQLPSELRWLLALDDAEESYEETLPRSGFL